MREAGEGHREPPGDDRADQGETLPAYPADPAGRHAGQYRAERDRAVQPADRARSAEALHRRLREQRAGQREDHGRDVHREGQPQHRTAADETQPGEDVLQSGAAGVHALRAQRR